MDPQYFSKSRILIFAGRFFKAIRIFSRDVPFFIIVTILFNFVLQMYSLKEIFRQPLLNSFQEYFWHVASSGLATGPHLDFRIYKSGVAVDPLKMISPPGTPVSQKNLALFTKQILPEKVNVEALKI
jgi:hypothetical protein